MPTDLQTAALDYLGAGFRLLALKWKKPNGRVHGEEWSWEDSFHGAPANLDEIEAVKAAFSNLSGTTGIAILIPPDFYVADVDSDAAAQLLLDMGWKHTEESVIAKTKNGLHVWFWYPGLEARNRWVGDGDVRHDQRTLLFKGLGGYVVAPPSLHFDAAGAVDGSYEWVRSIVSDSGENLIAPDILPAKLADRFKAEDQFSANNPPKEKMSHFSMEPDGGPWYLWKPVWEYNTGGLERAIETAADGNQNNVIHWAAMTCAEEGVPLDVAMERLMAAAIRGNHPKTRARDTIRGAYKRAARG